MHKNAFREVIYFGAWTRDEINAIFRPCLVDYSKEIHEAIRNNDNMSIMLSNIIATIGFETFHGIFSTFTNHVNDWINLRQIRNADQVKYSDEIECMFILD